MEQMADKRNLGAEVKDKRRANADEDSSTRARGERIQKEAQLSDQRLSASSTEVDPGESSKQTSAKPSNEPESSSSLPFFSLKVYLQKSASSASVPSDSLSSSQQSTIVDCAGMVLTCLFCQFCDLFHMLPESCARLVHHCCPNYKHIITTIESTPSNEDDVCDLDCGLFDCCHDAGDCLELAMEVSQLCYH